MRYLFRDRHEAGIRLAEKLSSYAQDRPVVLALPRGGVPVARPVAVALEAPLDVVIVRKLGVPWQPELAMGAIGEGGVQVLEAHTVKLAGVTEEAIAAIVEREEAELKRRLDMYRRGRAPVPVEGRTVIIVDDGIATGATATAAIEVLRRRGAQTVVLAVPVAPPATVERMRKLADDVVVVATPVHFAAVGQFYADFDQIDDATVAETLALTVGG